MGKTRLHIELAKCKSGVMDWNDASRKTLNYCNRRNFEEGEMRELRIKLKEKIIDREILTYKENTN